MTPQDKGRLGNRAARDRNPDHQSIAGKAGIRALADRHFDGSIDDTMAHLRSLQTTYQLDQAADERNARTLANGREIACEEIPICIDPENDPTFWQTMVISQSRGRSRAG